jgi:hypothetical protein
VSLANRFWAETPVMPVKFVQSVATRRVALEGRPVGNGVAGFGYGGCPPGPTTTTYVDIPETSAAKSFTFQPSDRRFATLAEPRRPGFDIAKCQGCHGGRRGQAAGRAPCRRRGLRLSRHRASREFDALAQRT